MVKEVMCDEDIQFHAESLAEVIAEDVGHSHMSREMVIVIERYFRNQMDLGLGGDGEVGNE